MQNNPDKDTTSIFEANKAKDEDSTHLEFTGMYTVLKMVVRKGRRIMIKRLKPEFRKDPAFSKVLIQEYRLGAALNHPNIVQYFDHNTDEEGEYIELEYIDGTTLNEFLKGKEYKNNKNKYNRIITQFFDALAYLHAKQIYHCDLKPDNILVSHKGNNLKLIDLGCATADYLIPDIAGNTRYGDPDQFKNPNNINEATDLIGAGKILLEIFTRDVSTDKLKQCPSKYKKIIQECLIPTFNGYKAETALETLTGGRKRSWRFPGEYIVIGLIVILLSLIIIFAASSEGIHPSFISIIKTLGGLFIVSGAASLFAYLKQKQTQLVVATVFLLGIGLSLIILAESKEFVIARRIEDELIIKETAILVDIKTGNFQKALKGLSELKHPSDRNNENRQNGIIYIRYNEFWAKRSEELRQQILDSLGKQR